MSLESMWTALEAYQPYAEKHGFGEAWLKMTTERTVDAAAARPAAEAEDAAWWETADSAAWAWAAAWAAECAADTTWTAAAAESAIAGITRAIELEGKETA